MVTVPWECNLSHWVGHLKHSQFIAASISNRHQLINYILMCFKIAFVSEVKIFIYLFIYLFIYFLIFFIPLQWHICGKRMLNSELPLEMLKRISTTHVKKGVLLRKSWQKRWWFWSWLVVKLIFSSSFAFFNSFSLVLNLLIVGCYQLLVMVQKVFLCLPNVLL